MVLVHKTSRLYFSKYLTQAKKDELIKLFTERTNALNFLQKELSSEAIIDGILPVLHTEGIHSLALNLLYDSYVNCGGTLAQPMFYLVLKEYVKAVKHNIKQYGRDNFKSPKFKSNQIIFNTTGGYSSYDTSKCYALDEVCDMKLFDMCLRLSEYSNSGFDVLYIPLKKHRQFNKLYADGYLTSKVILTDKYVEVTFEKRIDVSDFTDETISISKNGDLRLSNGDRLKFNLNKKRQSCKTSGQIRHLKNQVKTLIKDSIDFEKLNTLSLDYRAVGKYYSDCSFCKSIIKALCKSNRVIFTDAYSSKTFINSPCKT